MKLMTHVVIGYPSIDETIEIARTMIDSGADFVELQIPFSDPLADGPTIMKASEESLANGTRVDDAFKVMKKLTNYFSNHFGEEQCADSRIVLENQKDSGQARMTVNKNVPLLLMCYYNNIFKYPSDSPRTSGVEKFCKDAKEAGAYGLIVPDIPVNEERYEHFYGFCRKYELHTIIVISPNTKEARLKELSKCASGFVYVTSRLGTTGTGKSLDPKLKLFLGQVKKYFKIPVAVGFGISSAEQIRTLKNDADMAVVGSALINVIDRSTRDSRLKNVGNFIRELKMVK